MASRPVCGNGARSPSRPVSPKLFRGHRALLWVALVIGSQTVATAEPKAKIYVEAPGVYAVPLAHLSGLLGDETLEGGGSALPALTHRGRALPLWRDDHGTLGKHLLFLVPAESFDRPWRKDGSSRVVLLLGDAAGPSPRLQSDEGPIPPAKVERYRRFERDLLRAPLDQEAADAGVESAWYWRMISHQASSKHELELGDLGPRAAGDPEPVISVGLLGWSNPKLPKGIDHHRVDLLLNDRQIGTVAWDGRASHVAEVVVSSTVPRSESYRLTLKIPKRFVPPAGESTEKVGAGQTNLDTADGKEIIDLVYVDRVDVRFPVSSRLASSEFPLLLPPAAHGRRLSDPHASPDALAISSSGWVSRRDADGGWTLPAGLGGESRTELWVVEPSQIRAPIAIEPITRGARALAGKIDYLMIAPRDLSVEAERLADFHRERGLHVVVVDPVAIYDGFGQGEKSPESVRFFLDAVRETSPALRYLLLVGDADWLTPEDTAPYLDPAPTGRDRVPTHMLPSTYGLAVSDHVYAADPTAPASPLFAVGRLPVVNAEELALVVDKIIGHAKAQKPSSDEVLLMLSDGGTPSLRRRDQLIKSIEDVYFRLAQPDVGTGDVGVLAAFDHERPSVVHFGGHGGRFQWQLGEVSVAEPIDFFDREDVARLAPTGRQPVVISASCATAPFDHPSADSLGEVMVLAPERGAIAFLGSGVRLYTPRLFSEQLIRALARETTVGDAMVEAKRATALPPVSYLYNLLGDPAQPLR